MTTVAVPSRCTGRAWRLIRAETGSATRPPLPQPCEIGYSTPPAWASTCPSAHTGAPLQSPRYRLANLVVGSVGSAWLALVTIGCLESEFEPADAAAVGDGPAIDPDASRVAETADGQQEVSLADAATVDVGASDKCPGGVACACADHGECGSGVCLETSSGKKCIAFCIEGACPAGFSCGAVTVTGAAGQAQTKNGVCLPRWARECVPCTEDAGCPIAADSKAACVDPAAGSGQDGTFCAPSCAQDADCPPNRTCQTRTNRGGGSQKYCVPTDGVCICSPLAVTVATKTNCTRIGVGVGICKGVRSCTDLGLQPCTAAKPIAEACNGIDDDCDGPVDEPNDVTPICDDSNSCTSDSCKGAGGCVHLPTDASCSDGDACTDPDNCVDGKCVGSSSSCDDANPCTSDACDKTEGCTHGDIDGGDCNDSDACTQAETCTKGACQGGTPLSCKDDNNCTNDLCEAKTGCVFLPNEATCSDGNACTGADGCKGGGCQGPALVCDDGWGCTTDACDPAEGCSFKPGATSCGQAKIPYKIDFACNDVAFVPWKVTAPGIGLANPVPPLVGWKVDDTPALGGLAQCALNVNNSKDLVCGFGQKALLQTADSPWFDATSIAPGAPLLLKFESAGLWATDQTARVLVRGEVGVHVEVAKLPPSAAVWGKVTLDLSTWVGKTFQIRYEFSGADCGATQGVGWFVRKLELAVDPCATNNGGCSSSAICSAAASGLPNCVCSAGFSGDGKSCTDINECTNGSAKCADKTLCTNTNGGFSCGCKPGYSGDGINCSDIDECKTGVAICSVDANCTNTVGSFTCKCKLGYSGDGKTCKDIDECATGNGGCATAATCTNTPGASQCACKAGYTGDGKTCADVDECTVSQGGCAIDATCTNVAGSVSCACKAGYLGDGKACLLYGGQETPAQSCKAILGLNPASKSGPYYLVLAGTLVQVQCDMLTEGGGWTLVSYKADLAFNGWPKNPLVHVYLANDFQTSMTPAQIKALQAVSTEGRQTYVGLCNKMVHHFQKNNNSYAYAFGFRFADGSESAFGMQSYAPLSITVTADGCQTYGQENGQLSLATVFAIISPKVPIMNVKYRTVSTITATKFGSPLLQNPAMLR